MVRQTRREFLKMAGMGTVSLVLGNYANLYGKNGKRPNIVLIFTDERTDLEWIWFSFYSRFL